MTKYMKYKQLAWTEEEPVDYDGLIEQNFSCYMPALDKRFNICKSGDRFYPIWRLEPAEGYATFEEAKAQAQLDFEEEAEALILLMVDQVGIL